MNIKLRQSKLEDLEAINRVIESAVMTWDLPERVKRLSLSSYRYTALDYEHLDMVAAVDQQHNIIGVAAWEQVGVEDVPAGKSALSLHGIYVDPSHQHQGIGRQLFQSVEQAAEQNHLAGVLVKAQADSVGFFQTQGMRRLTVENIERDYANRYWKKASN